MRDKSSHVIDYLQEATVLESKILPNTKIRAYFVIKDREREKQ